MTNRTMRPRSIDLQMCRVPSGGKSCTVNCHDQEEIIVVLKSAFNQMLAEKNIEPLAVGNFISEHLTEVSDARQIKQVFGEFGLTGKAYEKTIRGTEYIIFKGRPGLRRIFTGTKYGLKNTKVINFGIGKAGVARSIKVGTIWSLVFVNTWNIAEYFIKRDKTLTDLGATMLTDSVKAVLAAAVGGAVGAAVVALGAPIIVPLAAGLAVSILVGMFMDWADDKWKISESFRVWTNEVINDLRPVFNDARHFIQGRAQLTANAFGSLTRNLDGEWKEWKIWFDSFSFGVR